MTSSGAIPKMLRKIWSGFIFKNQETFDDDEQYFYDVSGLETLNRVKKETFKEGGNCEIFRLYLYSRKGRLKFV